MSVVWRPKSGQRGMTTSMRTTGAPEDWSSSAGSQRCLRSCTRAVVRPRCCTFCCTELVSQCLCALLCRRGAGFGWRLTTECSYEAIATCAFRDLTTAMLLITAPTPDPKVPNAVISPSQSAVVNVDPPPELEFPDCCVVDPPPASPPPADAGEAVDPPPEGEEPDRRNRTSVKLRRRPNATANAKAIMMCFRVRGVCLLVSKSFTTAPSLSCAYPVTCVSPFPTVCLALAPM